MGSKYKSTETSPDYTQPKFTHFDSFIGLYLINSLI